MTPKTPGIYVGHKEELCVDMSTVHASENEGFVLGVGYGVVGLCHVVVHFVDAILRAIDQSRGDQVQASIVLSWHSY